MHTGKSLPSFKDRFKTLRVPWGQIVKLRLPLERIMGRRVKITTIAKK